MNVIKAVFRHTLVAALVSWAGPAFAQAPAAAPAAPQGRAVLIDEPIAAAPGWQLTATRTEFPPGHVSETHSHPGETLVYILEGRLLNQINDEEPKIYGPGDHFFEHANAQHTQFENLDKEKPVVVLIIGIRPAPAN